MNSDSTITISLAQQIGLAAGVVIPLIAAAIIRPYWTSETKALTFFSLCVVIGLLTVMADGRWNVANVAGTIGVIFIEGSTLFARLYRPIGLAPAIEENINAGPPRRPRRIGATGPE